LYDQLRRPPAAAVTLTPVTQNSAHPLELVKLLENGTADIVPDLRRAYRLLAGAITDHSDMKLHEAYLSFVERNQPLSTLLDS
ncbi:hypothetical protein, partial [Pseudomonas aeruginosa]|uniref:hypothetical protein n=1 Tax=Pseudomonas aeruginosa TaxID=287 RepID=UPI001C8A2F7A